MTPLLHPLEWLGAAGTLGLAALIHLVESARHPPCERVLILGGGSLARRLVEAMDRPGSRCLIAGVAAESPSLQAPLYPLMARLTELNALVARMHPQRIIVALEDRRGRLPVQDLLEANLHGIAVEDGVEVLERLTGKVAIESLSPARLIFLRGLGYRRAHAWFGRLTSLVASAAILVASAPLLALVALLVRLDSPGPILFVQERIGLKGRRFRLLKFRTMAPCASAPSEWVRDNEGRLTRLGRVLRRLHLDELPQLVNVLRGDMNLVGPRPHPARNLGLFQARIPYYDVRHAVRPGLTGWAQVRYGYANDLYEETEKVRYDLYYLTHRSPALDLRIALATLLIVLRGRGAEGVAAMRHAAGANRLGSAA